MNDEYVRSSLFFLYYIGLGRSRRETNKRTASREHCWFNSTTNSRVRFLTFFKWGASRTGAPRRHTTHISLVGRLRQKGKHTQCVHTHSATRDNERYLYTQYIVCECVCGWSSQKKVRSKGSRLNRRSQDGICS